MIDFFTADWTAGSVPDSLFRDAYVGCAHIWPARPPFGEWEWWVECGDDLERVAGGYSDSIEEAKQIAAGVFSAVVVLRPDDGPRVLPLLLPGKDSSH
ncbi:hypothetical protein [Nocardia miyunensis]|uniref:hypothetical protein n=1 Tax=Nocardia miyunensis TaxID=282684 RepID=UPI00082AD2E9|nr:hypothetical protein [Nocardia miyunensis]